jgi:pimeloyl-ACP methyl ester carboxylesterase
MSTESESSTPTRKTRALRAARRLSIVAAALYVLAAILLFFLQPLLIFPGAYVHSHEDAMVRASADHELIDLKTPRGNRITAVFGKPLNIDNTLMTDSPHHPTILFFYGNGDCIATSMGLFDRFRHLGANVLIPEYIGYPLSPGSPSEQGCYDTANAACAYLLTRHDVDPDQIVVIGRSIGSGPAIDLASREPVAGLVTVSAFTSMDDMAHKIMPIFPTSLVLRAHFQNIAKISAVRCPILMIHGTADDLVPFDMMARLAKNATAPVSFFPVERADHNDIFLIDQVGLFDRLAAYIESISHVHDLRESQNRTPRIGPPAKERR